MPTSFEMSVTSERVVKPEPGQNDNRREPTVLDAEHFVDKHIDTWIKDPALLNFETLSEVH